MLVFVDASIHDLKTPFFLYLLDKRSVYGKVTNWCGVLVTPSGGGAGEVVVVGREEEEYTFADKISKVIEVDSVIRTHLPSQRFYKPMQRQVQNKSNLRACVSMSLIFSW